MATALPRVGRRGRRVVILLIALLVVLTAGGWLVSTWADWLWFSEVHFTSVFTVTLRTKAVLFGVFGVVGGAWLAGNLYAAYRLAPKVRPDSPEQRNLDRYRTAVAPRRRLWVGLVAVLTGVLTGLSAEGHWADWLLYANAQPFHATDPQFKADIGFYVFDYPFYRYLITVGFTLVFLALLAALLAHWLFGGVRLSGRGDRITAAARLHLSILVALFVALKAVAYFLDQRGLVLEHNGVTGLDGAGYTGINALLPAKSILAWVALVVAVGVLVFSNAVLRNLVWPGVSLALLAMAAVTIGGVYPAMVSSFTVKPNVLAKEQKYIGRSIQATRAAYGLSGVKPTSYPVNTSASPANLGKDPVTVPNVRLLDPSKVSDTFTQLQQGSRSFYSFGSKLGVDRYTVNGTTQDYMVGLRELDSSKLTGNQQSWQNRHTVFTHGYGFVAAPAGQVCGTLPNFVSGVFTSGGANSGGASGCASGTDQIKVSQPRVYYGNLTTDYSIVGRTSSAAPNREYDGQQGTSSYDGSGGVPIGSFGRKLLYATYFQDSNFLLSSDYVNKNSKVLYVRNPRDRVQKVAPFLTVDGDPYPAVVNGRITWILDCYTTASTYPYAQRTDLRSSTSDSLTGTGTAAQQSQDINYIRNSVKATVDAYTGKVNLYAFDGSDPVLKAWNAAYGGIVKPASAVPPALAAHFRYPEDLFKVQRDMLARFHVTDPQTFNNQGDTWTVPKDPTVTGDQKQPPYYLMAQYPGQAGATFQLTSTFTRGNNTAALMSASYDATGRPRLSVLNVAGNGTVLGPAQAQQGMRQQAGVRSQLTLSESKTSQLDYGNLLVLPVQGALLYVEPVYIKSQDNNYPQFSAVLLAFGQQVGYGATVNDAIASLNAGKPPGGTTAPPGGGTQANGDQAAAVQAIQKALNDLATARRNNDYKAEGDALNELDKATKQFEQAQKSATPSPSARPSASGR